MGLPEWEARETAREREREEARASRGEYSETRKVLSGHSRDMKTMISLLQPDWPYDDTENGGGESDSAPTNVSFTNTCAYWGDLTALRAQKAALETALETEKATVARLEKSEETALEVEKTTVARLEKTEKATVARLEKAEKATVARLEKEKNDLVKANSQYRVDLDYARYEFDEFKTEIAKERAILVDQQRAQLEAQSVRQRAVVETQSKADKQRQTAEGESRDNRLWAETQKAARAAREEALAQRRLVETPEAQIERERAESHADMLSDGREREKYEQMVVWRQMEEREEEEKKARAREEREKNVRERSAIERNGGGY